MPELLLDPAIRDWVLIPIVVIMFLMGVLRNNVMKMMRKEAVPARGPRHYLHSVAHQLGNTVRRLRMAEIIGCGFAAQNGCIVLKPRELGAIPFASVSKTTIKEVQFLAWMAPDVGYVI